MSPPGSSSGTGSGAKSNERITRRSCVTVARRGELAQLGVGPTRCFGHDRSDLIQRQLTGVERRERHRQITTPPGQRHQLAGVGGGQSGFPRQPVRRRDDPRHLPHTRLQRFGDEAYQLGVEHVAVTAQIGEAVLETFQSRRQRPHAIPIVHMFDPTTQPKPRNLGIFGLRGQVVRARGSSPSDQ